MSRKTEMDAPTFTPEIVDDLAEYKYAECRKFFANYRRYVRPGMMWGWWLEALAHHFTKFYDDFENGLRPVLILMAPPQHGKSWNVEDFITWVAGKNPELKIMFASYSEELGVKTNLSIQRTLRSDLYQNLFPKTYIDEPGWKCDSGFIEFVNAKGSFRNTTVNGQINGMEQHIGVIDDPVKGRAEVNSKATRDKTWNWFTDDFMGRFNANSGMIITMTRWHVDDLVGRALEVFPKAKVLRYPAISELNTKARRKGEALFPAWKPRAFLEERQGILSQAGWESLYQQNPIIIGGGMFPVEKFTIHPLMDRSQILHSVRYWDKAGTEDGGAYTAGVLMHKLLDGRFTVEHVVRGQWAALERESHIRQWTKIDATKCPSYDVWVEQEPGSGGKESAENTVRQLSGYNVHVDKVTGAKEVRAEPYAAQVQGGNILLVPGEWDIAAFIDEHEVFPNGRHKKDQVDAAAGAFAQLALKSDYDHSYRGWAS